jgi:quercetin dioxygenase-like cupin family protein
MSDNVRYSTPFDDTLRWVTGEEETAGAYAILERSAPAGARSPGHQHKRSEAFYVLDGELTFTIDGRTSVARPGDYLIAAEMVSHGWENTGGREARVLIIFAPSVQRAYFSDLDAAVRAGKGGMPDEATLAALMRKHDWL